MRVQHFSTIKVGDFRGVQHRQQQHSKKTSCSGSKKQKQVPWSWAEHVEERWGHFEDLEPSNLGGFQFKLIPDPLQNWLGSPPPRSISGIVRVHVSPITCKWDINPSCICISICLDIHARVYIILNVQIYIYIHLSIYLSICLFIYLSIYLSRYPYTT